MTKYKYSQKNLKENQAKAVARDASVSTKTSIETVKFLKGKTTKVAIAYLEKVLEKRLAIPYTRFTDGVGHRPGNGITSGRYPQKLSKVLITLIKSLEANASMKGLGEELKIVHFVAHRASTPMHYGRHSRREMKRTHIEIIAEEVEEKKKKPVKKKEAVKTKVTEKVETKKEVPKEVKVELKVEPKVEEKTIEKKEEAKIETPKEIKKEAIEVKE
jgi:large subunit ribosomal protein L22